MHESFERNDASKFTRSWFSWANSLFASLILQLAEEKPHLIFNKQQLLQQLQLVNASWAK
jgi:meiotically up-regulated gene 157 (Mug157) protein